MERTVDFAAIARVAKRAELKSIRLIEITASCNPTATGALVPSVELDCKPGSVSGDALEVVCEYAFRVHSDDIDVVSSTISYLLEYEIGGGESPNPGDVAEFARANGALNSWPFVREILYSLTSRMGFPPFTLPLMHFSTKPTTSEGHDERLAEEG